MRLGCLWATHQRVRDQYRVTSQDVCNGGHAGELASRRSSRKVVLFLSLPNKSRRLKLAVRPSVKARRMTWRELAIER
jgi:hypothetical protein